MAKESSDQVASGSNAEVGVEPQNVGWQFNDSSDTSELFTAASACPVTWTADEFKAHPKNSQWFIRLAIFTAALAGISFIISPGDFVPPLVVIIVAFTFGVLAVRKPRKLEYAIDDSGVHIGQKLYPFSTFKSFSIVQEDGMDVVWLMPLKRFMPILSLYFEENEGSKIVEALANTLPLENRQPDPVDRLMHKIKF